jgi:mRNA interferase MazF
MRRGEIWWVSFPPGHGGEIRKRRPAVIVSTNVANARLNRVQVVPTTSNTARVFPSETLIKVGGLVSKAMADQIMTVSKEVLETRIGLATAEEMARIGQILRFQLGLRL